MGQSMTGDIVVISGGASGVDTCAEEVADGLGLKTKIFRPEVHEWEPPKGIGFKARNLQIVEACDVMYCLPVATRDTKCYHCDENHQKSGGCFTLKYAKKIGKETHLIPPIER